MTVGGAVKLGLAALVASLLAVPFVLPALGATFWVNIVAEILIWSLLAASVNLLFGYVGLLSFGQALFFGFGMYGVALSINGWGVGFWPALAIGIIAASAMALVAGVLAVRLTWHYFAIITVVFSLIFYFAAMSMKWLTGGDDGISFAPPPVLSVGAYTLSLADATVQYLRHSGGRSRRLCPDGADREQPAGAELQGSARKRSARRADRDQRLSHQACRFRHRGRTGGDIGCPVRLFRTLRVGVVHVLPRVRRGRGLGHRRRLRAACWARCSGPVL